MMQWRKPIVTGYRGSRELMPANALAVLAKVPEPGVNSIITTYLKGTVALIKAYA